MKKILISTLLLTSIYNYAQTVNFVDETFKSFLLSISATDGRAKDASGRNIKIDANNDGQIQLSEVQNVAELIIRSEVYFVNRIPEISYFSNLRALNVNTGRINEVNVSGNPELKELSITSNYVQQINTEGCSQLEKFALKNAPESITNLDFLQNESIKTIDLENNLYISTINFTRYPNLQELVITYTSEELSNQLAPLNLTNNPRLTSIKLRGLVNENALNFTSNTNLKSIILSRLANINSLDFSNNRNLEELEILTLNNLHHLQISNLPLLKDVIINTSGLTSLDLGNNPVLEYVYLREMDNLNHVNLEGSNYLFRVNTQYLPMLNNLDLSNKPRLKNGFLNETGLNFINFEGSFNMTNLVLQYNNLEVLDLSSLVNLTDLSIQDYRLKNIDLSHNSRLRDLSLSGQKLEYINLKNGSLPSVFYPPGSLGSINLKYVCGDDNAIDYLVNKFYDAGYSNLSINSYCSFRPGGIVYDVIGNSKFNFNNSGSDNDIAIPFQKYLINNGIDNGALIGSVNGEYQFATKSGITTLTPQLENPNYYNFVPPTISVNFPSQASPFVQDFRLISNGIFNDLEVIVIPIEQARPGFEAKYKLIYKNKGTTTQSGNLSLNYNDEVVDFISSSSVPSNQSFGELNWNFTNLQPFETREIDLTLRLNSPMQNPPLNGDDILVLNANVNGTEDFTPNDNTFELNQIIVNSFDPNDKTCLEGSRISEAQVGDYVHYLIRFENTGTANAVNVVVKDLIDTTKFDISSLVTLSSSHPVFMKIGNTNRVEFIFENIDLPYEDHSNDGYVMFKIKTKETLNLGDQFSNTAEIYFDYNFPIITNTYTTTVDNLLSVHDNSNSVKLNIYPNPIKDFLNIDSLAPIIKAEIYDLNGRIISIKKLNNNKINLNDLSKGNYLIKLYTHTDVKTLKFIKN